MGGEGDGGERGGGEGGYPFACSSLVTIDLASLSRRRGCERGVEGRAVNWLAM